MSWKRSQPPNSSMISRYFTSDRFSSGAAGSGVSEIALGQKPAGQRAVAEKADAVARALVRPCRWPAAGRAPSTAPGARRSGCRRRRFPRGAAGRSWSGRDAGSCRRGAARRATRPPPRSPARRSPTSAAAPDRGVRRRDAPSERSTPRTTSAREWVGSRSRSGTYLVCTCTGTRAAARAAPLQPLADQRFDAGVDVGAVEGRDARVDEPIHVGERGGRVDGAVAAGQLPPALQQARDRVAGRELNAGDLARSFRRQRHGGHVAMAKRARADAGDAEPRAAVGIGTRDVGVGGHPVVRVGQALLRRQEGSSAASA